MPNPLLTWWNAATGEEKKSMAEHCKTTTETLRQEAHAYRNDGALNIGPGRAAYVASASRRLEREGLPALKREDLCPLWKEIEALDKKELDIIK
jgi:hypothetical protein